MKYDVIVVGAGPNGYFCSYELIKKDPSLKVLLIDKGHDITKRRCPVLEHKLDKCPVNQKGFRECYPACSITSGFGGSGAYSDGKFNITTEFGGWLTQYMSDDELLDIINYVDDVNLSFGATPVITDPTTKEVKDIERKAMSVGVEDLKALKPIYKDLFNQNVYCVLGNENVIESNKELFDNIVNILE